MTIRDLHLLRPGVAPAKRVQSLWKFGGISPYQVLRRVLRESMHDNILGRAAELGFYFTLALFPMLIFLTTLLGMLATQGSQLRDFILGHLATVIPPSAFQLVVSTLDEVTRASDGGKLTFGIVATIWSASAGMTAVISTLNAAYDVEESRPFWKVRGLAVLLTVAISIFVIASATLVLFGGNLAELIGGWFGLGSAFVIAWKVLQWPLVFVLMTLAFAFVYYFAPDVREQKWYFITPGSALGLTLWLLASFAFRTYLHYFDNYSATYGSLGAVIILMFWLYVTGLAILIGGEVNSEIEHAAAERGDPNAKAEGEKEPAA
jgi:membrane protein